MLCGCAVCAPSLTHSIELGRSASCRPIASAAAVWPRRFVKVLVGEGMPKGDGSRGDLRISFDIEFPELLKARNVPCHAGHRTNTRVMQHAGTCSMCIRFECAEFVAACASALSAPNSSRRARNAASGSSVGLCGDGPIMRGRELERSL